MLFVLRCFYYCKNSTSAFLGEAKNLHITVQQLPVPSTLLFFFKESTLCEGNTV